MDHEDFMEKLERKETEVRALKVGMCPKCGYDLERRHDVDGVLLGICHSCHEEYTL